MVKQRRQQAHWLISTCLHFAHTLMKDSGLKPTFPLNVLDSGEGFACDVLGAVSSPLAGLYTPGLSMPGNGRTLDCGPSPHVGCTKPQCVLQPGMYQSVAFPHRHLHVLKDQQVSPSFSEWVVLQQFWGQITLAKSLAMALGYGRKPEHVPGIHPVTGRHHPCSIGGQNHTQIIGTLKRKWSTQENPTQTRGEHTNSLQTALDSNLGCWCYNIIVLTSTQTLPDDDYSDPFDIRHDSRGENFDKELIENNGYMEPYEAQRVIAEFQRKGEKKCRKGLQLYDTPYEPQENDTESDTDNAGGQKVRESRLPQDDERPADEYDQPWEWKKDHISKAFAVEIKEIEELPWPPPVGQLDDDSVSDEVQFDGCDWDRSSPSAKDRLRQQKQLSPLAGGLKYSKTQTPEHCTSPPERVDPALPLEKQVWYHGAISRADAENLLMRCKECSYLVRNSETSRNDYSLSLRSSQGYMHMKFSRTKDSKYILGQNSPPFDCVPEVINHYTSHKLPIKGAEHLSLLFPVTVQTL
ncbi:SH2 domain-containing adapter protein F-like [Narcine bancroftii]|uniref:SH2 domain-containing adapter protein F-like n=1 Tax=Narcine bancroftii TaxID=1343680 RepID=UPI003831F890